MASQYDLYSPKSAPRANFEDTLDSLESVPDVGILDTIESGIDKAANTGWMMSTVNNVLDNNPSIDNFLTGGRRDRTIYDQNTLKGLYPDAPEGTFTEPMSLLRASTMYDQTTAELRYAQNLKVREAGSIAQFGYGLSQILEPQSAFAMVATSGASSLALGRYAPKVAQAIAQGGLKYTIGKDILDGVIATNLVNVPNRLANKDYIKEKYGIKEYAEEMIGNVAGAFAIHMGSSGLAKAGLWGVEKALGRKILSEADARMAESMGDAYTRAASAFDDEIAGMKSSTFTEDANRVYNAANFTEARHSDGNGEYVFGYKPSSDRAAYRGTEPRFGNSYFTGPETLLRAASMDAKEVGTLYRVSLSEANPFNASPVKILEDVPAFFKAEQKKLGKEQARVFNTAREIYSEQGITLPESVKSLNDLVKFSIEKVGDNFRTAELALQADLTGKGYGGISYMTDKGVEVHYMFDHVMKNAQDLEDMHNAMSLNDRTASASQQIAYDPFASIGQQAQIGMSPVDTSTKSFNLQADGILSNGKKIKLDPNGYFETEFMYESPDVSESLKMDYVHYLSKEMIDDINRVVEEGSAKDITKVSKKYGMVPEEIKEQMMEIKLRQDFDATLSKEQSAMEQANDYTIFNRLDEKSQGKILKDAGVDPKDHQTYIELSKQREQIENLQAESTAIITDEFNKLTSSEGAIAPKSVDELTLEAVTDKRLETLDAKRNQIEKAMQKFAPQSPQQQALQKMLEDFEKEYLNVTMDEIEQVGKATKVCTSRNS